MIELPPEQRQQLETGQAVDVIDTKQEVEKLAAQIDWERAYLGRPPQGWFDDTDNPCEPEAEQAS